ncbi:MAG: YcbK family protein [Methylobacter sp.]|nr:YcbK family protein [Methylobacter sp.]
MNEFTSKNVIIDDEDSLVSSRRRFLKNIAYGSLLAFGGTNMANAGILHFPSFKSLALENMHTGDKLKLTYFEAGSYIKDALQEISYLFRDYHTGDTHPIDPALLDQLYDLKLILGVRKPFHLISGYRSPVTNARLRRESHGVAKNSFHMQGRAIDIQIAGVETKRIRNAAIAMKSGGVGYYPRTDFVHLDTGNFRTW